MYKIATLNKISPVGLNMMGDNYEISDNLDNANGIIVRSAPMHDIEFSKDLLAIARAGAGYNNIPTEKCAEKGIVVFNTPGANSNAVKELILGMMIVSSRNLYHALNWVGALQDDVKQTVEKGKNQFVGNELVGKTLGIVGLGAIGVLVANAALSVGMKVVGYDPFISLTSAHKLSNEIPVIDDLAKILPMCDYVTLHVPSMDETKNMMDVRRFSQMKDGAVLMNFSRDTLVNDDALLDAIASGKIKDYITDFPNEKVLGKKGVLCVPHLGASTAEAEDNCAIMAANQIMDYIERGNITNSVNYPHCSLGALNPNAKARVSILNKNIPTMLGKITGAMADLGINIEDLTNKSKGDYACTIMDISGQVDELALLESLSFDGIIKARIIK